MPETRFFGYVLTLTRPSFVPGQGQDDGRRFKQLAKRKRGVKETCFAFLRAMQDQHAGDGSAGGGTNQGGAFHFVQRCTHQESLDFAWQCAAEEAQPTRTY
jgi:hypothetical protein